MGGAGGIVLLGTLLLSLPQASTSGHSIGVVDALFTATSAVCVTGLIVLDTPQQFTTFGHAVLLFLFQVGGVGYMTAATFVALILGRRVGLRNRLVLKEAMASPTMDGLLRFATLTVQVTLVVESIAALLLTVRFATDMPLPKAVWYGVFHAVSAFNNAGFALFSDSLTQYRGDPWITTTVSLSVLIGGLGFLVLSDVKQWSAGAIRRLSIHTRLTLWMTVAVGVIGSLVLFMVEPGLGINPADPAQPTHWLGRIGDALFMGFAARTAGFATLDIGGISGAGLYLLVMLMIIGGGPGSTAGGIKVTTVGVILASLWSTLRGREQVHLFHRSLPPSIVQKSFFLGFMAFFLVTGVTWVVLAVEGTPFLETLFEVTSAVATVGLSVGDGSGRSYCANFGDTGKLLLTLCMFIGRLGPLTIGIAVLHGEKQQHYRLPTEKVLIG